MITTEELRGISDAIEHGCVPSLDTARHMVDAIRHLDAEVVRLRAVIATWESTAEAVQDVLLGIGGGEP